MPEGDTVYLAATRLNAALAGEELLATDFPTAAQQGAQARVVLAHEATVTSGPRGVKGSPCLEVDHLAQTRACSCRYSSGFANPLAP